MCVKNLPVIYFYNAMYFYTGFYFFELVNIGWTVIKMVLNLDNSSEFDVIAVEERKMSASIFLKN